MATENSNSSEVFGQKAMMDQLKKKWNVVLEDKNAPAIKDEWRKAVTATILENMSQESKGMGGSANLFEAAPVNNAGNFSNAAGFSGGSTSAQVGYVDPILINLIRRSMPNLMAYDICGVQPMTGPTGLIFALRAQYISPADGARSEAMFNEADPRFSGTLNRAGTVTNRSTTVPNTQQGLDGSANAGSPFGSTFPGGTNPSTATDGTPTGFGLTTAQGERLGDGTTDYQFNQMGITIDKATVTAKTRALKAEYTMEMSQDLKAVHGLDAETELANILSAEILAEINREVVRNVYAVAKAGCVTGTTTSGTFDLSTDSNGRWSVERFKGLLFRLEQEANAIAKETRRGKGNILICSSDVASALSMAGVLDCAPALNTNLQVDDTGNTFAGVLNGKMKVYIDPYYTSAAGVELACVGYRGNTPFDAGMFYCPYVPLQLVKTVGQDTFQPRIAFRTRYGLVANPYALQDPYGKPVTTEALPVRGNTTGYMGNQYYRLFRITNLV